MPDDDAYDFGKGAGFYVDATEAPWSANFRMRVLYRGRTAGADRARTFPADMARQGITGHSMGGHGALTIALRNPEPVQERVGVRADRRRRSHCPWGEKALTGYLGADRAAWRDL